MRTTLEVRDDLLEKLRNYAKGRSISNGAALSEILERGFAAPVPIEWEDGIWVFSPGPKSRVTAEHVLRLKDQMEGELP